MEPDAGHFVVDGIESKYPEEIRRRIGVLPENLGFPRQITGIEYLTYFGQLYGRTRVEARDYSLHLLQEVGLEKRARSLIGTYSHGMRQRIGIARALVNDPRVIFLDEPTLGLDPRGQQELLALIRRIAAEHNAGVILCSHALSEIEEVCNDAIILMTGRVIASGTVAEVVGKTQRNSLRIRVPTSFVQAALEIAKAAPNVMKAAPVDENTGWLRIDLVSQSNGSSPEESQSNNKILEALIRAEIPILAFETEGGRLQDIFLQLTEEVVR
jgi:ABC-2 type transport system ATP-binding protein